MKTPFIPKLILLFILFFLYSAGYAQQRDSVTIRGQVTDYNGQPIDSCSIFWQSPSFDDIKQAITDKNGYYTTRIPKGKYQSMGAINMSTYPHTVKPGLAEKDQRLEFWAWNFIADRDTTLNIRYHRMEVYGLRIFHIPGGMPTYQIYVRPMSLTRTLQWQKEEKSSLVHAQDLSKIEQTGLSKQAKGVLLAPSADKLKAGQRKILRGISDKILSLCETNESSAIMETNGYRLLLPEGTLDYFNISDVKESSSEIVIYLEEKNELPGEYSTVKVESKGFYDPVVVRDFPIRGKNLFLNIRRRRWILKDDGRYVSRNWKLVAEGSRMTHEFASFLKELY